MPFYPHQSRGQRRAPGQERKAFVGPCFLILPYICFIYWQLGSPIFQNCLHLLISPQVTAVYLGNTGLWFSIMAKFRLTADSTLRYKGPKKKNPSFLVPIDLKIKELFILIGTKEKKPRSFLFQPMRTQTSNSSKLVLNLELLKLECLLSLTNTLFS